MIVRILTGVILAPLVIILFVWGPSWANYLFFQAVCVVGAYEYYSIVSRNDFKITHIVAYILTVLTPLFFYLNNEALFYYPTFAIMLILVVKMIWHKPMKSAVSEAGTLVLGMMYAGVLYSYPVLLAKGGFKPWLVVLAGIVWLGDTAAYFVGKFLGKVKLFEAVSPKKTVEGAAGGIIGSVIGAFIAKFFFSPSLGFFTVFTIAVVGAIFEQVGDLVESVLKRSFGVKDSGTILPGHGGILDRFDGFVFAAPIVYWGAFFLGV